MSAGLIAGLASRTVIILDGCDGTGKTTLARAIAGQHGHTVIHSGRTPDSTDIVERYRQIIATPGRIVLDRSFISELVYGPLFHRRSRIAVETAISLAEAVADRHGTLVHLTGDPDTIVSRLRSRDGTAPPGEQVRCIIAAYETSFALLEGAAPIITADTTKSARYA